MVDVMTGKPATISEVKMKPSLVVGDCNGIFTFTISSGWNGQLVVSNFVDVINESLIKVGQLSVPEGWVKNGDAKHFSNLSKVGTSSMILLDDLFIVYG